MDGWIILIKIPLEKRGMLNREKNVKFDQLNFQI